MLVRSRVHLFSCATICRYCFNFFNRQTSIYRNLRCYRVLSFFPTNNNWIGRQVIPVVSFNYHLVVKRQHLNYSLTDIFKASDYFKTLGLEDEQIELLTNNYPSLCDKTIHDIDRVVRFVTGNHLAPVQDIHSYPYILTLPTAHVLNRLSALQKSKALPVSDSDKRYQLMATLLIADEERFKRTVNSICKKNNKIFADFDDRVKFFCSELDLSYQELSDLIFYDYQKYSPLVKFDLKRLKKIMSLLKKSGVTNIQIQNDFWIFRHNYKHMSAVIKRFKRNNFPIKLWALRIPKDQLDDYMKKMKRKKRVLNPHKGTADFLAHHLKCDDKVVKSMEQSFPRLLSIAPIKLLKIITFLQKSGYTSKDIIDCPRILFHRLDTIKLRIEEVSSVREGKVSLAIVVLSIDMYTKFLNRIIDNSE